jgi:hypothetical protein
MIRPDDVRRLARIVEDQYVTRNTGPDTVATWPELEQLLGALRFMPPKEGPLFLMHVTAGEGVKPHPLDTHSVMLPEGMDVYGLLADACGDLAEQPAMEPFTADVAALRKLADHFGRLRQPD